MMKCSPSKAINKCGCGSQVCARCGSCRRENRQLGSISCRSWGTTYKRHIWKWEPDEEAP
jgi:hypothetical protein